jgi:predicted amidohydrolase
MKAKGMARDYQALFGGLAKEFHVTLVAGSIVLPEPGIIDGTLKIGRGALYNSSVVFDPEGVPIGQPQRQLRPFFTENATDRTHDERAPNVFDTPAGRLGILIGRDSWYAKNYRKLDDQSVQLVAVPAFVAGRGAWDRPWRNERGDPSSGSISPIPGDLSEGQAWHRLTLTTQAPQSQAIAGVSVFLRGQFWDQGSAGQSFLSSNGQQFADGNAHGARLLNLWL